MNMARTTAPATATEEDLVVENPELVNVRLPQSLVLSQAFEEQKI